MALYSASRLGSAAMSRHVRVKRTSCSESVDVALGQRSSDAAAPHQHEFALHAQ
ncbi:MAG: hypothetical protein H0W51_04305 [Euzebyales bacterium]|nr:hypothetical protein [Euzebyales bacterium]